MIEDDFVIIENTDEAKNEFAKRGWGQTENEISKETIQALLDGKAIAFGDGEYTHIITLLKEENK